MKILGISGGGNCACVLKDDFARLDEKYLGADGIIFTMPIFEKGTPGAFEIIRDRMAGPNHDTGLLEVARKIARDKGTDGPDPRHFKKRFASFIGIGASDWDSHMAADFGLFAISAPLTVIDTLVFNWSKASWSTTRCPTPNCANPIFSRSARGAYKDFIQPSKPPRA